MNAALPVPTLHPRVDLRLLAALGYIYVVWGSTYLAMRIAVAALPPWGMAGARFVAAGLLALAIARVRGEPMPSKRDWLLALPTGVCLFVCGNGLVAVAEQSVSSSVAAVVAATTPLFLTGVQAVRGERTSRAELVGMGLGIAGVLVLLGGSGLLAAGARGLVLFLAPVGWALGSLLVRARGPQAGGLAVAAPQMLCGGAVMLGISVASGEHLPAVVPSSAILAWMYLVVLGSLVGFTAYAWLLRNARPAVAMSYAYVNPLVAVALGAALGGEHLGASAVIAALLIASGVMVAVGCATLGSTKSMSRSRLPGRRS